MSKGAHRAAVAFSGGIDSVLTAYYLKETGVQIQLVCIGMKDSPDFISAQQAADHLNLPLNSVMYTEHELRNDVDSVIRSVEEANPMKIGVGLPLYWVAKTAVQHGITEVYSGNGADELFAGYDWYVADRICRTLDRFPGRTALKALAAWSEILPPSEKKKGLINKAKRRGEVGSPERS